MPSFCEEMLKFPIFFHRRHFGWILFLLNLTSFIFVHFPTFCDRKVSFIQVLLFVLVVCFLLLCCCFSDLPCTFLASDSASVIWLKMFWFLLIRIIIWKSKFGYLTCCLLLGCHCYWGAAMLLGLFRTTK